MAMVFIRHIAMSDELSERRVVAQKNLELGIVIPIEFDSFEEMVA